LTDAVRAELIALLPRLRRFACGLTGSVDEGDDLVQQACERALTRLHQWQPGTRLDSWMFRIVQTCWIDRHRKRSRGREVAMDAEDVDRAGGSHPGREPEARLELSAAERAIAALPEDQRAVLLLTAVDGCSYREAAETLDIPIGTVMSRLARARTALARALDGDTAAPAGRRTSSP
jgi:RNA polymerase sigma-70 factor (ECF subfamily)